MHEPRPPANLDAKSASAVPLATGSSEPDSGVAPQRLVAVADVPAVSRRDLLAGEIRPAVLWLALPVLGEQFLNAVIAWNDTFLAGRIDAIATAAVGFGAYASWLVSMLFSMVGIGATAIVARSIGARRYADANHACNQAFVLSLLVGFAGSVAVSLGAPALVRGLGLSAAAMPIAITYLRIDALGYAAESLTFIGAACLRGAGDTRTPLKLIGAVNVLNAIVSWTLTFGVGTWPGIGANGIAWGTAIARTFGGILTVIVLARGRKHLRLDPARMRLRMEWVARIIRIGLPASVDGMLMWMGHFVFMGILTRAPGRFSSDVLYAAHIVGIRIESISYLPAFAWSLAASTMVGQNLGAGRPERALAAAREARLQAVITLLAAGASFLLFAEQFFRFLSNDPLVAECGVPALRALAFFQPFVATLIVYLGALRGAGDTLVPMAFTVIGMVALRVPIAYLGAIVLKGGLLGAWYGMFADLVIRAGLMTWRLRSGGWRRVRV